MVAGFVAVIESEIIGFIAIVKGLRGEHRQPNSINICDSSLSDFTTAMCVEALGFLGKHLCLVAEKKFKE